MVYAYYGDGQGKTSILNGLCVRAVSAQQPILFVRFFKGATFHNEVVSHEDATLARLGINVVHFQKTDAFIWTTDEHKKAQVITAAKQTWAFTLQAYKRHAFIFLDEGLDLVTNKIVSAPVFANALRAMNTDGRHVFVSGHTMNADIASACDLITHCVKDKHPFDKNQKAIPFVDY